MAHNRKLLEKKCNKKKTTNKSGSVNHKRLNENLIYKATVKSLNDTQSYIDFTESTFKDRYTKNKKSFKHEKYGNATTLLNFVGNLILKKLTVK